MSWHTTFGDIEISERLFLQEGRLVRPFSRAAGMCCRGYSQPLQRRVTDLGADVAFGRVPEKLEEHYGIRIPVSAVREITERHARRMYEQDTLQSVVPAQAGAKCVIAELDGSMVPLVDVAEEAPGDRRKTRTVRWKEARLCLAHPQGSVSPVFRATLGGPEEAGDQLLDCAIQAGLGTQTQVHCVGDGAPWIADQVDRVFGAQGHYLLDFYHLCEYLSAASPSCTPADPRAWLEEQKQRLKQSQLHPVLHALQSGLEPHTQPDKETPVRTCYRYLIHRTNQVDYHSALEAELPIGSGEIESAHRYIIQERLKIAGAWWKQDNAQCMLTLRTVRANHQWENYWVNKTQLTAY